MGKRKLRRKSKSAAVYIPTATLVIMALMVLGISAFLRILEIEVIGASMYTDEEIIMASGIGAGDNMLFVNKKSAALRIISALSYISNAEIGFTMPDKMHINVIETKAVAAVGYRNGALHIDSGCKVLSIANNTPESLIDIIGITPIDAVEGSVLKTDPAGEPQLRRLIDILTAIETEGVLNNVAYIDIANIANISLGYAGRFTVILGSSDNIGHKLRSLPGIIADANERANTPNEEWTIDMSDRGGRWIWSPDS